MSSLTKGQKRLLVVMALVLAYGVFDVVTNKESYFSYYSSKSQNKKAAPANVVNPNSPETQKRSVRNAKYLQNWGDDPFYNQRFVRRVSSPVIVQTAVELNLKAISFSGENSVVMINDRVLMTGDVIEGYQVVKIEPSRVTLNNGSENKILTLR